MGSVWQAGGVEEGLESNAPRAARLIGTGMFCCGTVIVEGEDFIAENGTFENSAPQPGIGQEVAIRVTADCCAFYNCRFLDWQDTLYLYCGRLYFRDCYIEGSVDFIFGNATALLEHCHIHFKSPGFITAQRKIFTRIYWLHVFERAMTLRKKQMKATKLMLFVPCLLLEEGANPPEASNVEQSKTNVSGAGPPEDSNAERVMTSD